jgi:hypothetical protein
MVVGVGANYVVTGGGVLFPPLVGQVAWLVTSLLDSWGGKASWFRMPL